jgi:hypothetical protein
MYNYTMRPIIRPAGPSPTSAPLSTQPNIIPTNVRPPIVYRETQVPNIRSIGSSDIQVFAPAPRNPSFLNPRGISTAPAPYGTYLNESLVVRNPSLLNPRGISTKPASYGAILEPRSLVPVPSAYPTYPGQPRSLVPVPSAYPTRPIPPEVGLPPRPPPLTPRSRSLEERLAGKNGRQEIQMTPRELREILEANGLPVSKI